MNKIALVSTCPATGKTTTIVNLASGLVKIGKHVLIMGLDNNDCLYKWLGINKISHEDSPPQVLKTFMNIDVLTISEEFRQGNDYWALFKDFKYDYLFMDTDSQSNSLQTAVNLANRILACTDLLSEDEVEIIAALDKKIRLISSEQKSIDLIVPCKINAKEWENNSSKLLALADIFGYEKIADFIPYCTAIQDLPQLGKTVWDLPERYQNRKEAFEHLLKHVEEL